MIACRKAHYVPRVKLFAITYDGVTLGRNAVGKVYCLNSTESVENGKRMVVAGWPEKILHID